MSISHSTASLSVGEEGDIVYIFVDSTVEICIYLWTLFLPVSNVGMYVKSNYCDCNLT